MGLRTLLCLLVLIGGLAAVLFWTDQKPPQEGAVSVPLLDGRRLSSATRLHWQYAESQPIELRRAPGGPFRLSLPVDDVVARSQFDAVLNTYDTAQLAETPLADTEEDRRRAGLEPPRLVVQIDFEDGAHTTLEFGTEGPMGRDVFLRKEGRIWRGSLGLFTVLRAGVDDWREPSVFQTPPAAIREVVIDRVTEANEREVMRLLRTGSGWRLVEPIEATADVGAATNFVANVLALRVDVFLAGVIRLPETPPDVVLTVRGGREDEVVRLWIDSEQNLFGRIEARKLSFKCLREQYVRIFTETATALRSRILVPIADIYHEIGTMMVEPGGDAPRLVLHRPTAESPWEFQEPISGLCDPGAANSLMTAINNLRAVAFVPAGTDPAECGLQAGGLRVGAQSFTMAQPVFLRIGADARHGSWDITYAARVESPDEIVKVPQGAVEQLRRPWADYVPRRIFRVQESVTRVDLHRRDDTRRLLTRRGIEGWRAASGAAVDDAEVSDLVDLLRDLQAEEVLLARTVELGDPDWSVVMGRESDPEDAIGFGALEVWDRSGQPLYVRSRTGMTELVYKLSRRHSQDLRRLWQ
ncbi:MAG: DUF4340 domain-containing protein [Planctomycetota bacterium]